MNAIAPTTVLSLPIAYTPSLLPDELLYSWLARLVTYNALGHPRLFLAMLFGTKDVVPSPDLPTRLEDLHCRLGTASPVGHPQQLVDITTLYPYHRPFLAPERHLAILQILLHGNGKRLKTLLGRVANRFGANPPLRYCPACLLADIECQGASYWHRSHQLPGVTCCATHSIDLVSLASLSNVSDKQRLILAPEQFSTNITPSVSDVQQRYFSILSRDLLEGELPVMDPLQRKATYEMAIRNLGFQNRRDRIDHVGLAAALRDHYHDFEHFPHRDRLLATSAHPLSWLRPLLERPSRASHPICHLLLIGFLFNSIDRFKQMADLATQRLANRINQSDGGSQVQHNSRTNREATAILLDRTFSCRQIAEHLHLSVTTVVSRRRALGIPIAARPKHLFPERRSAIEAALKQGQSPAAIAKTQQVSIAMIYRLRAQSSELRRVNTDRQMECKKRYHRKHWLQLSRQHHDAGTSQLRALAAATYAWLYRHDRAWLRHSCHDLRQPRPRSTRVDWSARDLSLCLRAQAIVESTKPRANRPRISKTFILRQLGDAMVRTNLDRLENLKAGLDQWVESPFAYRLLRIDWAIDRLISRGISLKLWRIQRLAGIRNFSEALQVYAINQIGRHPYARPVRTTLPSVPFSR